MYIDGANLHSTALTCTFRITKTDEKPTIESFSRWYKVRFLYEKPKISTIFLLPAMAFGIIMYGILLYFFGYLLHDYLNGDAITLYLLVTFFSSGEELYFDKVFGCSWLFFKANKFIARKVTKLACVYAGIVTVVFIMIRASQTIKNVI